MIGDVFEDEKALVSSSVDLLDYDNYHEWFEATFPSYVSAKTPPKTPLESNRFALVKKELEKVFRERENNS